eukprot:1599061-Pyramimonas_sp.AAC.1
MALGAGDADAAFDRWRKNTEAALTTILLRDGTAVSGVGRERVRAWNLTALPKEQAASAPTTELAKLATALRRAQ